MTTTLSEPLPLTAARTFALHAQGLASSPRTDQPPDLDTIYDTVAQLGCVQIDTLHVVQRSQYLVLWSRLGSYDTADFDRLVYDPAQRRLFEYWHHAASIIPLVDYRYRHHRMAHYRNGGGWRGDWIEQPENRALVEAVKDRIRDEGPLKVADFEDDGPQRGAWWDWKPAKRALETLYNRGELMISDRVNFHRVYDLHDRVLPDWVDTSPPTLEETRRTLVGQAVKALGICEPGYVSDYVYDVKRSEGRQIAADLVAEGVLVEVEAERVDGRTQTMVVHRDQLPALAQAADGAITAQHTTFLSPFDSFFWAKGRDEDLWGFRQRLEAYKPAKDRIWGYFCLPILHHDRLIGRFDPKMERKTGTLRFKTLYLEPDVNLSDELIADVAGALRDFMRFHDATDLVIERSDPAVFGEKLLAAL